MNDEKILLVDDEPDIIEFLGYNLTKEGFDVLIATSGSEAIEVAKKNKPDLIILDVMMPEMDGFTMAKKVHEQDSEMPIVFLSANKYQESIDFALDNDGFEYLTKPFDMNDVLRVVKKYLH